MPETLLNGLMMDDYPLSLTVGGRAGGAPQRLAQGRLAPTRRRDPSHHARRVRRPGATAAGRRWPGSGAATEIGSRR